MNQNDFLFLFYLHIYFDEKNNFKLRALTLFTK